MQHESYEEDFIYNLLIEAGYSPEKDDFEGLKEEIEPLLMDKIISRVFEELSNEQRKEIMKLFDAKQEAEALSKVEKMIPDYDNFLEEVFQEFAEEYLRTVK
jgi:Mg/Co/Ni transporter MgtE